MTTSRCPSMLQALLKTMPNTMPPDAPSNAQTDRQTYKQLLTLGINLTLGNARRGAARSHPRRSRNAAPASATRAPIGAHHA